jgi:hypothetical protein
MNRSRNRRFPLIVLTALAVTAAGLAFGEVDDCPDAWISTKVGTKLLMKRMINVVVDTEKCVVTLTGCVKSDEKRQKAQTAAENTKHVTGVNNEILLCEEEDDPGRSRTARNDGPR